MAYRDEYTLWEFLNSFSYQFMLREDPGVISVKSVRTRWIKQIAEYKQDIVAI